MLVLTPPDADPLLLTGANDAQLFAYSIRRFQTVSLTHLLGHFVISLVMLISVVEHGHCCTLYMDDTAACLMHLVPCVHLCLQSLTAVSVIIVESGLYSMLFS